MTFQIVHSSDEQDLPSTSTTTDSFGCMHGQGSGRGCRASTQQRDKSHNKLCVNFHDHEPTDMASTAVTETSLSTDPDDSNLVDNVCDYFDTNLNALYAHVANHYTEENKKKHNHWRPPKLSSLPPADV